MSGLKGYFIVLHRTVDIFLALMNDALRECVNIVQMELLSWNFFFAFGSCFLSTSSSIFISSQVKGTKLPFVICIRMLFRASHIFLFGYAVVRLEGLFRRLCFSMEIKRAREVQKLGR